MQFRDLKSQYRALRPQMDEAIQAVLDSSDYIAGDQVEELEKELNGDRIPPLYGGGELSRQLKHLGERRIDAALRGQHRSELLFRQHLYALLRRSGGAFFRLPEAVPQL